MALLRKWPCARVSPGGLCRPATRFSVVASVSYRAFLFLSFRIRKVSIFGKVLFDVYSLGCSLCRCCLCCAIPRPNINKVPHKNVNTRCRCVALPSPQFDCKPHKLGIRNNRSGVGLASRGIIGQNGRGERFFSSLLASNSTSWCSASAWNECIIVKGRKMQLLKVLFER